MKNLCLALLLTLPLLAIAQTAAPFTWDAATYPPQTARIQIWRGDTLPLAPRWGAAANTNTWTFTAYWSTNNLTWWSKSLTGTPTLTGNPFLWTPDMDTGAAKYRLFIRASSPGGASYRANADLTMLPSPGAIPNLLPLPAQYIDFNRVTILNPPWATPGDISTATNTLAASMQTISSTLAASMQTLVATNRTDKLWSTETTYMDGDGVMWEINTTTNTTRGYVVVSSSEYGFYEGDTYWPHSSVGTTIPASPPYPEYITSNVVFYKNGVDWLYVLRWDFNGLWHNQGWSVSFGTLDFGGDGGLYADTLNLSDGNMEHEISFASIYSPPIITISTNIVTRLLNTNQLSSAIAAIPRVPTNSVSGWMLYDSGSNIWLRVNVSNLSFTVHEVL